MGNPGSVLLAVAHFRWIRWIRWIRLRIPGGPKSDDSTAILHFWPEIGYPCRPKGVLAGPGTPRDPKSHLFGINWVAIQPFWAFYARLDAEFPAGDVQNGWMATQLVPKRCDFRSLGVPAPASTPLGPGLDFLHFWFWPDQGVVFLFFLSTPEGPSFSYSKFS